MVVCEVIIPKRINRMVIILIRIEAGLAINCAIIDVIVVIINQRELSSGHFSFKKKITTPMIALFFPRCQAIPTPGVGMGVT